METQEQRDDEQRSENLQAKLQEMRHRLQIMEWDVQRDQINPAMKAKYLRLKEEYDKLKAEIINE